MIDTTKPISKVMYGDEEIPIQSGGDPWDKFNALLVSDNLPYLKKEYMNTLPVGFGYSGYQLLYSNTIFLSVKRVNELLKNIDISTFRTAKFKYCRLPDNLQSLRNSCFANCVALRSLIINSNTLVALQGVAVFNASSIANGTGSVYVPSSLATAYKTASYWSAYDKQIKGYSEAPTYDDSTEYEIGDVCQYNGKFYGYCKEDLTSSIGNAPSGTTEDNTYWEYVSEVNA